MDIGLYIADLLSEQDEVSVPGLGTFIKIRVAGSYDNISNSFRPPSYQVAFKNAVSGFYPLREYICSQKNLSQSSAEYFIKKFSAGLLELVNTSNFAEIKPLGIFHKKNDVLLFEASDAFELAGNFYGLKPIADLKKNPGPVQDEIKKEIKEEIEEDEYLEETGRSRIIPILLTGILALIIGAVALYYLNPGFNNYVQKLKQGIFSAKEQNIPEYVPLIDTSKTLSDSIVNPSDSVSINDDSLALNPGIPVSENKSLALKAEIAADESISFEIIGAAFAKRAEADNYIKRLASKGIETKIAENMPGKMLKISFGSYKDEASATTELRRIQKDIIKDAWIARVKPKKNP